MTSDFNKKKLCFFFDFIELLTIQNKNFHHIKHLFGNAETYFRKLDHIVNINTDFCYILQHGRKSCENCDMECNVCNLYLTTNNLHMRNWYINEHKNCMNKLNSYFDVAFISRRCYSVLCKHCEQAELFEDMESIKQFQIKHSKICYYILKMKN